MKLLQRKSKKPWNLAWKMYAFLHSCYVSVCCSIWLSFYIFFFHIYVMIWNTHKSTCKAYELTEVLIDHRNINFFFSFSYIHVTCCTKQHKKLARYVKYRNSEQQIYFYVAFTFYSLIILRWYQSDQKETIEVKFADWVISIEITTV